MSVEQNATQVLLDSHLLTAAEEGSVEAVVDCLRAGAKPDARDENGVRPMHHSAGRGDNSSLEALLNAGAEVEPRDFLGWTPLHQAASLGRVEVVRELLSRGASASARESSKSTPLHSAAVHGHIKICEMLLDAGADIEASDVWGYTPLNQAAIEGMVDVCAILLARGAKVDSQNLQGRTPIFSAASNGQLKTCEVLAGYPSALAKRTKADMAKVMHKELRLASLDVSFLITDFAVPLCDIMKRDHEGMTPLDIASKRGHDEVATFLEPFGIQISQEAPESEEKREAGETRSRMS